MTSVGWSSESRNQPEWLSGFNLIGEVVGRREAAQPEGSQVARTGCLRAALPGIILLDLMMPEMDGFEFMDALRRRLETRGIPLHLRSRGERIVQKGRCTTDGLLSEIRQTLARRTSRVADAFPS